MFHTLSACYKTWNEASAHVHNMKASLKFMKTFKSWLQFDWRSVTHRQKVSQWAVGRLVGRSVGLLAGDSVSPRLFFSSSSYLCSWDMKPGFGSITLRAIFTFWNKNNSWVIECVYGTVIIRQWLVMLMLMQNVKCINHCDVMMQGLKDRRSVLLKGTLAIDTDFNTSFSFSSSTVSDMFDLWTGWICFWHSSVRPVHLLIHSLF